MQSALPVEEVPFAVYVNGSVYAQWTASRDNAKELAVGRLFADGIIDFASDLRSVDSEESADAIRVHVTTSGEESTYSPILAARAELGARALPDLVPSIDRSAHPVPAPDVIASQFKLLLGRESERETSGLHTVALSDGFALTHRIDEIGRHNAVDKSLGAALLAGDDLHALGMLISARISGEIAFKAARAGVAWLASRSVPTTHALEIANAAGLPVIARAAGRDARVYGA